MSAEHGESETGAPDFIGVGAVAAGGGWWLRMLLAHPEVRGPERAGAGSSSSARSAPAR